MRRRFPQDSRGPFDVRWSLAAAVAVVAVLVAVILNQPTSPPEPAPELQGGGIYVAPQFDRLLGRDFRPYELRVRRNSVEATIVELASSNPKIRIYQLN